MKPTEQWQKWEPHGEDPGVANPWACFEDQDPEKELQAREAAQGDWRVEFKVRGTSIISAFKRLFGGKKK